MKLLIFPYNGNGLEALDCIGENFEFLGFVDDTPEKIGKTQYGQNVYGREAFDMFHDASVLAVPGSPKSYKVRQNIISGLGISEKRFATVIHPRALISSIAQVGYNVLIMGGVVIPGNAIIGDHCCILPNTTVHHDVLIGDYSLIGSNVTIAGHSVIGENCYIGSGSNIINNISIGKNTLIGLGTNVVKSLPENVSAIGNPARIL